MAHKRVLAPAAWRQRAEISLGRKQRVGPRYVTAEQRVEVMREAVMDVFPVAV